MDEGVTHNKDSHRSSACDNQCDDHIWSKLDAAESKGLSAERLPAVLEPKRWGIEERFLDVLLLGVGFMLSVGALQTCYMAQTVVLNSVHDEYFQGTPTIGYVCMGIQSATQALAYLFGPSVSAVVGPKSTLVIGAVCVSLYIACFIRPLVITIYIGSVILGFGVGLIWVVQGHFITSNSKKQSVERNIGIFWGMFQSSLIFGNLFYYLMLRGADVIPPLTRQIIFSVLLVVSVIGLLVFSLIKHPWTVKRSFKGTDMSTGFNQKSDQLGAKQALGATVRLGLKKEMLILVPFFFYLGMETTLWSNVYSTSLGYTAAFGDLRESLVGLNGVFLGTGEITASIALGLMGKWSNRKGRDLGLMFGLLVHFAAFYLIYLNLPADSSLHITDSRSVIYPNAYLAMFCTVLLGIGDAIWCNQLMGYLGCVYPHNCVAAFGVYQFFFALFNSAAFWYSTVLTLPFQLLIATATAVPAAAGFCYMEWRTIAP